MRSGLENTVLDILWSSSGPLTVREILNQVNAAQEKQLAYTTIMTVLVRLAAKGAVLRRMEHGRHLHAATAESAAALAVRRVLAEHGEAASTHFLAQAVADPAMREQLRAVAGVPCGEHARHTSASEVRPPSWTEVYRATDTQDAPAADSGVTDWTRWVAG
ncbi:BlaI/MecI/CopY family transcriptional regulator [Actinokineospora sp. HBU206404]|uniref:BlaI/MecI/CopY family transcriptional regulator n=2 Tax=Actinokineospora xionganensis TaxID=2684470 RepID=A0ABR7KZW7_9PSEU|nr:BlaI/MecI/CopY family transcriptional regulator [Actinokineospora xionganensis]